MTDLTAVLDWIRRLDGQASAFAAQRDAAMAEVEQLRAGLQAETEAHVRERDALRAAQPTLPDVGPVEWDDGVLMFDDGTHWHPSTLDWRERDALRELGQIRAGRAFLDAEAAAADTTPDTSRVTFGTRHEGTGMVLLQHADMGDRRYGRFPMNTAEWHHKMAAETQTLSTARFHAAHVALAEVREALNTAEAHGVDVNDGVAACRSYGPLFKDDPKRDAEARSCMFLAREVQPLVDQGLRGDDLNARVPYEVRDHRAPVDEVAAVARRAADQCRARGGCLTHPVEAVRAARTSQEADRG